MSRMGWLTALVLVFGVQLAHGQSFDGRYILESPRLVPIPAPRTLYSSVTPTRSAPMVAQSRTWPITTLGTTNQTVWYSAPDTAASVAPSLAPSACICCGGSHVSQHSVAGSPQAYPPMNYVVRGRAAPTVLFRPIVDPTPRHAGYYVGSGLLGQPKIYVPGQPVRNMLRFVSP